MIFDVWIFTIGQGKDYEFRDLNRRMCKYHDEQDQVLRCRPANPINGLTQKVLCIAEFESLDTMAKYWGSFFGKGGGWEKFKDEWDWAFSAEGSMERYQYGVPE